MTLKVVLLITSDIVEVIKIHYQLMTSYEDLGIQYRNIKINKLEEDCYKLHYDVIFDNLNPTNTDNDERNKKSENYRSSEFYNE